MIPRLRIAYSALMIVVCCVSPAATAQGQEIDVAAVLQPSVSQNVSVLVVDVRLSGHLNTYGSADDLSPVKLEIAPSDAFEIVGQPVIPEGESKSSDLGTRYSLTGEFQIRQKIRVNKKSGLLSGAVTMIVCEKQLCRPPKDFEFEVLLSATPVNEEQDSDSPNKTDSAMSDGRGEGADFDSDKPFDWQGLQELLIASTKRGREATVCVEMEGLGAATGVIVSPDGIVLTAGHCVQEPGTKFKINLHDKRSFPAIGLGMEPSYDCGLVQIDPESLKGEDLPWAEIGSAIDLEKNVPVFSLGHGGGYDPVRGTYLRLGRVLEACSSNSGFIKNTALMEPGDSGGPLFNIHGQVVGIHSMIHKDLDANFDVPIELFLHFNSELKQQKKFRWHKSDSQPDYGMQLLRGRNRMRGGIVESQNRGIRISRLGNGGWAESQGLKKSDRFMQWENVAVMDPGQLNMFMLRSCLERDSSVSVVVRRGGETKNLELDFSVLENETPSESKLVAQAIKPATVKPRPGLADINRRMRTLESRLDDYSVVLTESKKVVGTLVFWSDSNTANYVVAKSSLIKDDEIAVSLEQDFQVAVRNAESTSTEVTGKIVARDSDNDLALIELSRSVSLAGSELPEFETMTDTMALGTFLVSPSPTDDGEYSVVSAGEFNSLGSGFLGVQPKFFSSALVIDSVLKGQAAEAAGLLSGDRVIRLNDEEIGEPQKFFQLLDKTKPGETAMITVVRESIEKEFMVTLGRRPNDMNPPMQGGHIADQFEGGKSKATEFEKILLHDARIKADQCGGPVFDLNGKFIGLNAARKSRTQTYILPASVLADFVAEYQKQEKHQ